MDSFKTVFVYGFLLCISWTLAQDRQEGIYKVSNSVDQFATKLLTVTRKNLDESANIALSPYTVWTLMTIISEGAQGNTLRELQTALVLPQDMNSFRNNFRDLSLNLLSNQNGVQVDLTNAIFATNEFPLNTTFKRISQTAYNVDINSVNFKDNEGSRQLINNYISTATNQRIKNLVNPDDIQNADIFMTSVLYFKGKWRFPFNKSETAVREPFYADDGKTQIGTVEMMHTSAPFPYTVMSELKAFAAELPYGDGDKYGMFVIVPSKNENLSKVLDKLSAMDFGEVIDKLAQAARDFEDEEIDVFLPKFTINSEFTMNIVLNQMGINDVFNSDRANLAGIFPQDLYLNRILQKAVIEVDEEGTVATSATGGSFAYKTMKPKLMANKPFAYFIVDKQTRSIIFEGKVSSPNGICASCTGI